MSKLFYNPLIQGLFITFSVLLGAFLLIELYFQVVYRAGGVVPHLLRFNDVRYFDEEGTPRLYPHVQLWYRSPVTGEDVEVQINSEGFRGAEPNLSSRLRVVLVGDSVLFDGALREELTTAAQLEKALQKQCRSEQPRSLHPGDIEVLNLSVPDVGLADYLPKVKHHALQFSPDIVIVGLYLNDMFTSPHREPREELTGNTPLLFAPFHLTQLFRHAWILFESSSAERVAWVPEFLVGDYRENATAWSSLRDKARYDWGGAWIDDYWIGIEQDLRSLKNLVEKKGATLVLVVLPVSPQVEALDPPPDFDYPQQRAHEIAARLAAPLIDPLPQLRTFQLEKLYYDQCHLTEEGARIMGELLAQKLLKFINCH